MNEFHAFIRGHILFPEAYNAIAVIAECIAKVSSSVFLSLLLLVLIDRRGISPGERGLISVLASVIDRLIFES